MISFYSPQMVATVNTTKYAIENDLTKKENVYVYVFATTLVMK